ncbi:conserved Plasmodium protein, unknown function [Plasmodium gallinaceum]|uniref:Uncharacterized protein n=1 Tax=Plasmodium gallinaceum TaxID=5849 RepID=A0A1J1GQV2_PLAGA|nr:conserved Plasmodium protein, unknown function [Plasmodium gallinaceum]CRG93663.1 conserved Plasmodium protein, unknown function [Plasmodium gallinaceum]
MFNYFLKSFNKCKNKNDVIHISEKFLKNIFLFNTYEISLSLNKFSKINFDDKIFWHKVCYLITTSDDKLLGKFQSLRKEKDEKHKQNDICEKHKKDDKNDINKKILLNSNVEYINKENNKNDKLINYFSTEELCLILNALSKVNVKNNDILRLASEKLLKEIDLNKHIINTIKAISYFSNDNNINLENVLEKFSKDYQNLNNLLTERDISVLIELTLKQNNQNEEKNNYPLLNENKKNDTIKNDENENKPNENWKNQNNSNKNLNILKKKLITGLKKFSYISEQSIALILNAYSKSLEKNKKLLDILKIIIILKLRKENKCSDIFLSSITHSYSTVYYKDKLLFNELADYTYKNINNINIKPLIIILNSFININILNIKLFNESLDKLANKKVILNLSNQCTSNVVTIFTKSYNYLDKKKIHFIFENIIRRIKRDYNLIKKNNYFNNYNEDNSNKTELNNISGVEKKKKNFNKNLEITFNKYKFKNSFNNKNIFIFNFLTKHLTNILNNFSKLNYADTNIFQIFTYLILRNKENINKLDFLNITSSYSRNAFLNTDIYDIIKVNSKKYILNNDLKYVEFINLFTSISTFYIIEKNENKKNYNKEDSEFKDLINLMIDRLKENNNIHINKNEENCLNNNKKDFLKNISNNCENRESNNNNNNTNSDDLQNNYLKYSLYKNKSDNNYFYSNIKNKNILDNLCVNHICSILSSLCKLNIHDKIIYEKCVKNIKKKIFKINSKSLVIYLLYVSKYNIIPDNFIRTIISNSFKLMHTNKYEKIYQIEKQKKDSFLIKMYNLYFQLQTNDIINSIYIIRCLIKNDFNYKNNTYIIYQYLLNICKIMQNKNVQLYNKKTENNTYNNIIKMDDIDFEENILMKNRKLNIQTSCILINSLCFLLTHLYFKNKNYFKIITFLLLYAFEYLFKKLNFYNFRKDLLFNLTDQQKINEIKNIIKNKIDSASMRQLNMSILILFYLNSLNSIYTRKNNLYNYPISLLNYLYFFLKYNPFTQFEKYSSIYNSLNNKKLTYNYDLHFNKKETKLSNSKTPNISINEINIYQMILNILKKKNLCDNYNVFSTYSIYMYSVDIIIKLKV